MNYDCYNLTNVPIINKIKMNTPYSNVSIINITYLNVSSTDTISINTRIIIISTVKISYLNIQTISIILLVF